MRPIVTAVAWFVGRSVGHIGEPCIEGQAHRGEGGIVGHASGGVRIPLTDMGDIGILGRAITGRAPCPSRYSQHKAQAAAVMRPLAAITTATRYYLV